MLSGRFHSDDIGGGAKLQRFGQLVNIVCRSRYGSDNLPFSLHYDPLYLMRSALPIGLIGQYAVLAHRSWRIPSGDLCKCRMGNTLQNQVNFKSFWLFYASEFEKKSFLSVPSSPLRSKRRCAKGGGVSPHAFYFWLSLQEGMLDVGEIS